MNVAEQLRRKRLQASVTRVLTLGSAAVVIAASVARSSLGLTPLYPMKAVAVFAGAMSIVFASVQRTHPFSQFGAANRITAVRAAIVALVAACLGEAPRPMLMVAVVSIGLFGAALDGLDGWTARRTGLASVFGARFDMETDALFVMTLSALAWSTGKAGVWILLAGLLRYLFVFAMQLLPWMRRQEPPSVRRKAICVVQIVGLSLVLLPLFHPPLSSWWCAALLATLCYSFGVDTLWLWQHRD